jgi:hypothetical protein
MLYDGMLYWINSSKYLVASSAGKVVKPIDLSSRDYLEKTEREPWKLQVGKSVIGALSGQNILPVAVGAISKSGRHAGTSVLSVRIDGIINRLNLISHQKLENFLIINANNEVILESKKGLVSDNPRLQNILKNHNFSETNQVIQSFNIFDKNQSLILSNKIFGYQYKIIYLAEAKFLKEEMLNRMMPYLLQILCLLLVLVGCIDPSKNKKTSKF